MNKTAWQSPSFGEIDMNAEIGGYQGDYGNDPPDLGSDDAPVETPSAPGAR